jgi:glycosyltransferase involved in cell wall biosynthesis
MRVAVFTDYVYRRDGDGVYAERAFALFLGEIAARVQQLEVIGRLAADDGPKRYRLPPSARFAALPHYESLVAPAAVISSLARSLTVMWRALEDKDVAWVLGPYPHAIALVAVALARRCPVVLGVRQDWPQYVRMRRPRRRWLALAADAMEWTWRTLSRRLPVVAVGADLASNYRSAPAVLELSVSVVSQATLDAAAAAPPRNYEGELRVLSVGRLEPEKNPLLLADVLAALRAREPRWRLVVCGEGEMAEALARRLSERGVREHAELLGYVAMGEPLLDVYRQSHALLHVSWTEGFPQVIVEAFATGLPVVATAVGGVPAGVGDAALLIAPGEADAAVRALTQICNDASLRSRLVSAGFKRGAGNTLEAQTERLVDFLGEHAARRGHGD